MINAKKTILAIAVLSFNSFPALSIGFQEAYDEHRANRYQSLRNAIELTPNYDDHGQPVRFFYKEDGNLDEEKASWFFYNSNFTSLKTLDLTDQNVSDYFIGMISANQNSFGFLERIILDKNPNITNYSQGFISLSNSIGSYRDIPTISATYNCPSAQINIKCSNTGITQDGIDNLGYLMMNPRKFWNIRYANGVIQQGIKLLTFEGVDNPPPINPNHI